MSKCWSLEISQERKISNNSERVNRCFFLHSTFGSSIIRVQGNSCCAAGSLSCQVEAREANRTFTSKSVLPTTGISLSAWIQTRTLTATLIIKVDNSFSPICHFLRTLSLRKLFIFKLVTFPPCQCEFPVVIIAHGVIRG